MNGRAKGFTAQSSNIIPSCLMISSVNSTITISEVIQKDNKRWIKDINIARKQLGYI